MLNKIKNKIIETTAKIISYPSVARSKAKAYQAEKDIAVLKKTRSFGKAPNFQDGVPTEAFKARSVAKEVKERRMKTSDGYLKIK